MSPENAMQDRYDAAFADQEEKIRLAFISPKTNRQRMIEMRGDVEGRLLALDDEREHKSKEYASYLSNFKTRRDGLEKEHRSIQAGLDCR